MSSVCILLTLFIYEPPIYLFKSGKVTEFLEVAKRICEINKTQENYQKIEDMIIDFDNSQNFAKFENLEKQNYKIEIIQKLDPSINIFFRNTEFLMNVKIWVKLLLIGLISAMLF